MGALFLVSQLLVAQSQPGASPAAPAPVALLAGDAGSVPLPDIAAAAQAASEAAKLAAESAAKAAQAVATLNSPPLAPPPPPAPPPPAPPRTTATVGLGLIWLQGNSNALTLSANAAVAHKFEGDWGLSGTATAAYGESEAPGTTTETVTAYNVGGVIRADKTLASEIQVFGQGGASSDHVQNLELRYFGELGAGVIWFDLKEADYQKLYLRTDIGFRIQEDNNWVYYATPTSATGPQGDILFVGPRFALAFKYAVNKGIVFSEDASVQENIDGDSRTMASSMTKFTVALNSHLSFLTTFLVTYDSNLSNLGKVDTDTVLTVGLQANF